MTDLISRQAAKDAFMKATSDGDKVELCWWVLDSVPIVNPAENGGCWGCQCAMLGQAPVKHGKLIASEETNSGGLIRMVCSECNRVIYATYSLRLGEIQFCPYCGVKLERSE